MPTQHQMLQAEFERMVTDVASKINPPKAENYYPLLTAPLEVHNGITITGTFETEDNTTDGRLSYVTVLRNIDSADPSNGYGFAWMKGDGSKYNVYLVDNSALANDLFVSGNFIVNPQGENAWKAAAKIVIEASSEATPKTYSFKLVIGLDYAMSLKIWDTAFTEPVEPNLSCAAPLAGPTATGTYFGIGVMGTRNCRWWYDNISINQSSGIHTATLFKLKADPTAFTNGNDAAIEYYGYGHDGAPASTNWGLSAFIYKKVNGDWTWTPIGTNTSTNVTDINLTKIRHEFTMDSDHRDADNFINLLTTSTYAASNVTEVSTYYTKLETLMPSGVHTGGCADIYINDPSNILVASTSINNTTGIIELTEANGFFVPLHSIVNVQLDLIGDTLVPNQDWSLVTPNEAYTYSTQEYPHLSISNTYLNFKLRIVYRYYKNGKDIQTLIDSDEYRYSGTNNLAKIMPPAIVNINNLAFRGNLSVQDVKTAISDYINGSTTSITLTDIFNTIYAAGASYIDIVNTDIEVVSYDYKRIIQDPVSLVTSYTLNELQSFFCDDTSMSGIVKE